MSDCKHCGGEIEFRYDGGRVAMPRVRLGFTRFDGQWTGDQNPKEST
jgi:hypothetical protein